MSSAPIPRRRAPAWNVQRPIRRPGEVTQSALAAFDVACWDLMGQALGVLVWKLLGGRFRDRVPAYANGWYQAERDPGAIAQLARQVVARGYRALKLDPFGAAARAARRRSPARRGDYRGGMRRSARMSPPVSRCTAASPPPPRRGSRRCSSPTTRSDRGAGAAGKRRGAGRVRAATRLPIATGERAHHRRHREFVETGVADIIQVDLTHFGGFLPMKHLAGGRRPPAARAAQRLRPGRHDGERALCRGHAELQGARALQRFRRPGSRIWSIRPARRGGGWLLRAAGSPWPWRQAEPRDVRGALATGGRLKLFEGGSEEDSRHSSQLSTTNSHLTES